MSITDAFCVVCGADDHESERHPWPADADFEAAIAERDSWLDACRLEYDRHGADWDYPEPPRAMWPEWAKRVEISPSSLDYDDDELRVDWQSREHCAGGAAALLERRDLIQLYRSDTHGIVIEAGDVSVDGVGDVKLATHTDTPFVAQCELGNADLDEVIAVLTALRDELRASEAN